MSFRLDIEHTRVFERNMESDKKITINRWWTRSGKTYSILQLMLVWLMTWRIDTSGKVFEEWIATIVRKQKSTLKGTAMRDREEIIVNSWCSFLLSKDHRNKSDRTYKYLWRTVEFIWADDQQKLRWGKRDILYCNEANELVYDQEFFQLLMRTTYKVIIDFNPDNEDIWINTELEQKRRASEWDVDVIVSTYKDNPFLPEMQIKEIERLETTNPRYWKVYWLWEYGKLEWVIFPNVTQVQEVPEEAELLWYWLDFWFTNDPAALVALYKIWDRSIVLQEMFYEYWLTNEEIFWKIEALWLDRRDRFIADSAEPKSIEELYRMWLNIKWVKKWSDSIKYGINVLSRFDIQVTWDSDNLNREFRSYVRDTDKEWKFINKPAPWFDHAIDAARYAAMELISPRRNRKTYAVQANWTA